MKKKIWITVGVIFIAIVAFMGYGALTTRSHSPQQTVDYNYQDLTVKVVYCKPYKKGRLIFGEEKDKALVPYNKYWRLGANEATEITFNKDVNFSGKPVSAGTYRMYAVPGATSWQVTLNSELGKFGYFEPDYKLDVIKVDVPVQTTPEETEQFTINFNNDSTVVLMNFVWDKTKVSVPITL